MIIDLEVWHCFYKSGALWVCVAKLNCWEDKMTRCHDLQAGHTHAHTHTPGKTHAAWGLEGSLGGKEIVRNVWGERWSVMECNYGASWLLIHTNTHLHALFYINKHAIWKRNRLGKVNRNKKVQIQVCVLCDSLSHRGFTTHAFLDQRNGTWPT